MKAVPKNIVASSQFRVHARSPRCAANTPSTIVSELDSRHAVMIVALMMLSLAKRRRPRRVDPVVAEGEQQGAERQRVRGQKQPHPHLLRIRAE